MSTKCCSGDGERRKDKGCGGGLTSKTKLCVTKLYVKDGVWRRKMVCVCDKVVCEIWCVWKLCVKESVRQSCVRKMVCDKVVCERWCVKDGGWQRCVWEMVWWKMVWDKVVCDKVVCERWCVKDGVWQSWVLKMVCERWCVKDGVLQRWCVKEGVSKMVCERWCVTKWCVKDGVWQSCVWKMVCQRWWVAKWCVKDGAWKMVGDKVGCEKMVCERGCVKDGATPATQNEGRCLQVPHLPRETKVDVTKCHACHLKCRGVTGDQNEPKRATRASPVP